MKRGAWIITTLLFSKNYTTHQINQFFYDHIRVTVDENLADDEIYLSDILNSAILNTNTAVYKDFEKCLEEEDFQAIEKHKLRPY